jgi:hypothetical protein
MYTKTWKIGEVCQGGIITVEIKIQLYISYWNGFFENGTKRSSNKSKAKEFTRKTVLASESRAEYKLDDFICELATSYWASTITDWVKTKVKLDSTDDW